MGQLDRIGGLVFIAPMVKPSCVELRVDLQQIACTMSRSIVFG